MSACVDILGGGSPLMERFCQETSSAVRIRAALGYVFLSGLTPVWDALESSGAELQFLIGNVAGQQTDEQRAAAADAEGALASALDVAASARAARARVVAETAAAIRSNLAHIEHTGDNKRLLMGLTQGIALNRIRVRIYPDGRLHSKCYLFERAESAVAIVGSSNITLPSPDNPTELNVVVHDPASVAAIGVWFDGLWSASQDFSRDLFSELSTAWPFTGA